MATTQKPKMQSVMIEGAELLPGGFKNFSGLETTFNNAGNRFFNLLLPDEMAEDMLRKGWNVKTLKPRDEGELPRYFVKVSVKFNSKYPPKVVLLRGSNNSQVVLGEDQVASLDYVEFENIDIIINPSQWTNDMGSGVKAYLHQFWGTIRESALDVKYSSQSDERLASSETDAPF